MHKQNGNRVSRLRTGTTGPLPSTGETETARPLTLNERSVILKQEGEHVEKALWIYGPPFAGKSFLTSVFVGLGLPVYDSDEHRASFTSFQVNHEMWRAWRPEHRLHSRWRKINEQVVKAQFDAIGKGHIVITHTPYYRLDCTGSSEGMYLWPGETEMARRIIRYAKIKGQVYAISRVEACIHYISTNPPPCNSMTADEIVTFVVQHFERKDENERPL
jgi:hypothetical protein